MLNYSCGKNKMKDELLKGLSEEQIEKVKECKNNEELLALAKQEGIELTDEQLSAVSGGSCTAPLVCQNCQSKNIKTIRSYRPDGVVYDYTCEDCGFTWRI